MRTRLTSLHGATSLTGIAVLSMLAIGCDPSELAPVAKDGDPFLIAGQSATQPPSPLEGTSIYVQARGGNYVGIVTHGGTHSLGPPGPPGLLGTDVVSSCAALPENGPLYLVVKPELQDCIVEVRLYDVCDDASLTGNVVPLSLCDAVGTLVSSINIPVKAAYVTPTAGAPSSDSGTDADVGAQYVDAGGLGWDATADTGEQ